MSYNNVEIFVDDETKSLRFGEALTSGSVYNVIVKGGLASVGNGSLVLMLNDSVERDPVVVASCVLKHNNGDADGDVSGTLSMSTEQLSRIARRRPGSRLSIYTVLHSDTSSQNVADGNASVKLVPVETNPVGGSAILFKGDKGNPGRGISSITDGGTDESGNRIAVFNFSDGGSTTLKIPKGTNGLPAKMTAAYNAETNKWYQVQLVKDPCSNGYVLCVDTSSVDLSDLPASDASASEAYGYAQAALQAKGIAVDAKGLAVSAKESAEAAAEQAQEYASQASSAGSAAGASSGSASGRTAAQAVISETSSTLEGYVTSASGSATSAASSAMDAAASASAASSSSELCLSYKESAEAAAETAFQAANDLNGDDIVYLNRNQDIDSTKTFLDSPIVPDVGSSNASSSFAASVNYVDGAVDDAISGLFSFIPLVSTNGTPTSTAASIVGSNYIGTVVILILIKVTSNPTSTLSISSDGGSTYQVVDFTSGNLVVFRKSVSAGIEAFKIKTNSKTVADYRYYRQVYCNVKFPVSEGGV